MTKRHLQFLGIFLLGLLAVWGLQQQFARRSDDQVASLVKLDPGVDPVAINRIAIRKGESDQLTLMRENEAWIVSEATDSATLAKSEDVDTLLKILDGVDVELVSQSVDRQEELGVDEASADRIEYMSGDEVKYTLLVSSANPRLIRQKDRENVYRWGFDQSRLIHTSVSGWLAPTPTSVPENMEATGEAVFE